MRKIYLILIFFLGWISAQNINFKKIEKEVLINNRLGKHLQSQKQLLKLLEDEDATILDQARINLLLSTTFRSLNDYATSINYLKKSQEIANSLPGQDSLKMSIEAETAFTYFDSRDYQKAEKICNDIKNKKYANLSPLDKSYIIMQEGYINYLKKNFAVAKAKYNESIEILRKNSPCNQVLVLVKLMQLSGKNGRLDEVDSLYSEAMQISDKCNILKYKIYATNEIKNIYIEHDHQKKVFLLGKTLDSMRDLSMRDQNLSEMHVNNQNFLEQENVLEKQSRSFYILISFLMGFMLIGSGIYFYRKSRIYKNQEKKYEEEIKKIKEELKIYSEIQFSNDDRENDIVNSEKLNRRQKDILKMVSDGNSNREIADQFSITEATVKYHLSKIYGILDIKNRKEMLVRLSKK